MRRIGRPIPPPVPSPTRPAMPRPRAPCPSRAGGARFAAFAARGASICFRLSHHRDRALLGRDGQLRRDRLFDARQSIGRADRGQRPLRGRPGNLFGRASRPTLRPHSDRRPLLRRHVGQCPRLHRDPGGGRRDPPRLRQPPGLNETGRYSPKAKSTRTATWLVVRPIGTGGSSVRTIGGGAASMATSVA